MATITLNEQEAQAAIQLFDLAVKSGGLQIAKAAIVLTDKIVDAINADKNIGQSIDPPPDLGTSDR